MKLCHGHQRRIHAFEEIGKAHGLDLMRMHHRDCLHINLMRFKRPEQFASVALFIIPRPKSRSAAQTRTGNHLHAAIGIILRHFRIHYADIVACSNFLKRAHLIIDKRTPP